MEKVSNDDTTVKLSKKTLASLESKARPFESKRDCIERVIMQSCSPQTKPEESGTNTEEGDE